LIKVGKYFFMVELFKKTVAYRVLSSDKKRGETSHAYLVVCQDELALPAYLTAIAKTIMCDDDPSSYCDECRTCRLIDKGIFTDVIRYPKDGAGKILVADIDELVSQTYVMPFEGDKKTFIICGAENMNPQAQNKLLKTLEEPPRGVYLVLGTSNENALLSTIKSRVKKLFVPDFSEEQITESLKKKYPDKDEREITRAVALADGKIGSAYKYMEEGASDSGIENLVYDVLEKMQSSKDVIDFTVKIDKTNVKEFLITLKKTLDRAVRYLGGCEEKSGAIRRISAIYGMAACLAIIKRINDSERAVYFNGNVTMLADGILLGILEEKYRWKKL